VLQRSCSSLKETFAVYGDSLNSVAKQSSLEGLMSEAVLNSLAIDLFKMFSRFEYSLKAIGFHEGEGDAKANWREFALSIEHQLEDPKSDDLRVAITYILNNPPKKQVILNGKLVWNDSIPNTNSKADLVLLYVRRIRNNLFHGGKFNDHWFAPDRSEELLRYSLFILKGCLEVSPDLLKAYTNIAP
jgi:hypothetical protein